jgi:hypothetical protein
MKILLVIVGLLIFSGCTSADDVNDKTTITIVACPSMLALFGGFEHESITIEPVSSSAHAFELVRSGSVHGALTGRPPTRSEAGRALTRTVRKGTTLLAEDPRVVRVEDLSDLEVAICVDDYPEGVVRPLPCESYPDETEHRVIDWESWNEEPFITVLDGEGKSLLFRGVYLTGPDSIGALEATMSSYLEGAS